MKLLLTALLIATGAAALSAQPVDPTATPPSYQPLTSSQRWDHYWKGTLLSPTLYVASLGSAFAEHLDRDPPEWREGFEGYARRTASEYAVHIIQASIHQSAAAALGYDSRYYQCDCKGFFRRTAHAVKWSFFTRNQAGQIRFDAPVMAGAYAGGMISMSWYPHRYNGLTDGVRVGNQEIGLVVGANIIREFGADLRHIFKRD